MAKILATGTTHIGHPDEAGVGAREQEHRYVTFEDALGSVHTVLLNANHRLTDPRDVVQAWEDGELVADDAAPAEAPAQSPTVEGPVM